jgi:PEGA domain
MRVLRTLQACGLAVMFLAAPACSVLAAQKSSKPLAEKDILFLLHNDVAPPRVAEIAKQYGVSFQMSAATEKSFRDAGATDSLIETLRELAPKPAASPSQPAEATTSQPVLLIASVPGHAQVYVDDEPMGTTSPEGLLKLSKLAPGVHRVRVAHAGYRDLEQKVTLKAGRTQPLDAILTSTQAAGEAGNPPSANAADSAPQAAFYNGTFENATVGQSGKGVLALQESGGNLSGCLRVMRPLFGSGPLQGFVVGDSVSFRVISPLGTIEGSGARTDEGFSGTYTVQLPGGTSQQGAFQFRRDASAGTPVPSDLQNCPVETSQDVNDSAAPGSARTVSFYVNHDHGNGSYCTGIMTIGNGHIKYTTTQTNHSFDLPLSRIEEVKKNAFYLAIFGGFHITPKHGHAMNFVVVNNKGVAQPSEPLILAVARAMAQN